MANIDVDELRKEVGLAKEELKEKEAVLRYIEKMHPVTENKLPTDNRNEGLCGDVIQLDNILPDNNRKTLITEVQDVVSCFGSQEFNVAHVDTVLNDKGVNFKGGKFPRSRISTTLNKLEARGIIVRTFTGGGNTANRYKLKGEEETSSL